MARKLNKELSFGEVYGHGAARYEQHGILFDADGVELPGFEKVKIPTVEPVRVDGDNTALLAEITGLREENERLRENYETLESLLAEGDEAEIEELQGKLDTANVEIRRLNALNEELQGKLDMANAEILRLNALNEELSKPADPAAPNEAAAKGSGKGKAVAEKSELDKQLEMQAVS